jgi:hypothetical protein
MAKFYMVLTRELSSNLFSRPNALGGYPHTLPRSGEGLKPWGHSYSPGALLTFALIVSPPTFGRFMARAAGVTVKDAALAKTSLSPVAHATTRVHDGRVLRLVKGHMSFTTRV